MGLLSFLTKFGSQTAGTVAGVGLSMASAKVFDPVLDVPEQEVREQFGRTPLTPSEVAAAVARDLQWSTSPTQEAAWNGISPDRLGVLRSLAAARPAVGEILAMLNRGIISEGEATTQLTRQGFFPADIARLLAVRYNPPALTQMIDLLNRGELNESEVKGRLAIQGFSPEDADALIALKEVLPGPSDVVRFAVREVYNPALRQSLGYDDEFPTEAAADAGRVGVSEAEMRKYWAAHWQLPSISQGFEMYHRGVITLDDLQGLLKAQDIPAVWRERLLQISFNPITRVDVRRMAKDGILSEEQVYRNYLDIGYKPEDARNLTAWTFRQGTADDRELTKSEVLDLYMARAIKADEAAMRLREIGYDAEGANRILALTDTKRSRQAQNLAVSAVRSQFSRWKLDERTASTQLDRLGVGPDERDVLLRTWKIEREIREPQLTASVLQRLLRKGIIDAAAFREQMTFLGWDSAETEWLYLDSLPAAALAAEIGGGDGA